MDEAPTSPPERPPRRQPYDLDVRDGVRRLALHEGRTFEAEANELLRRILVAEGVIPPVPRPLVRDEP
jgi:plasmid stability protein